jgi:hypothetical protein
MLLLFTIICVAAILLFAHEALSDLYDVWTHPEHRDVGDRPRHPGQRFK